MSARQCALDGQDLTDVPVEYTEIVTSRGLRHVCADHSDEDIEAHGIQPPVH